MHPNNQYDPNIERLKTEGYFVRTQDYFKEAYTLIKPYILPLAIYSALYIGISFLLLRGNFIGGFIHSILTGPIIAGYYYAFQQIQKHRSLQKESFLLGFYNFLPIVIVTVVSNMVITAGFSLFIIPGIFFSISYLFVLPLVVFKRMDFWSAMESSRIVVWKQFLQMLSFGIILIGVNFLGLLMLGVGVLFTLPLSQAALYIAYKDIFENNSHETDFNQETYDSHEDDDEDNSIKLEHFR